MNKSFLVPLLLTLNAFGLSGQYSFFSNSYHGKAMAVELQASGGFANCLTDLGGGPHLGRSFIQDAHMQNFRLSGAVSVTAIFRRGIGLRLEHFRGELRAADADIRNATGEGIHRLKRNLHFKTPVSEIALMAEIYPLLIAKKFLSIISPYFIVGFGLLKFNPQAELLGSWTPLNPLRTEGQGFKQHPERKPYTLTQPVVPVGGGFRYDASPLFHLQLEFRYRLLFTDYLDDVSSSYIHPGNFYQNLDPTKAAQAAQLADRRIGVFSGMGSIEGQKRGNPEKNDAYFSIELRLGVLLHKRKSGD